jgi:hypothetical protein
VVENGVVAVVVNGVAENGVVAVAINGVAPEDVNPTTEEAVANRC